MGQALTARRTEDKLSCPLRATTGQFCRQRASRILHPSSLEAVPLLLEDLSIQGKQSVSGQAIRVWLAAAHGVELCKTRGLITGESGRAGVL